MKSVQKPLIAILSRNARFTNELCARLKDRFRFAVCESIDESEEFVRWNRPAGFVADFAEAQGDADAAGRLMDDLRRLRPDMDIVMCTRANCPESLESRACRDRISHVRTGADGGRVALYLSHRIQLPGDVKKLRPVAGDSRRNSVPAARGGESAVATSGNAIADQYATQSPEMQRMLAELAVAAGYDVTILLVGETGSGKTYLSRLIHEASPRRDEPFLTLACGALPADLIASELFGHVKGAFTGAHANKQGKFLAAGGGTILLDEIDVLSPDQQVKLLRVIETGEFEPVGSNQTLKSRARLVVASNLDLEPLVEQQRFRSDLYYRLSMFQFDVLPLRERKMDIPLLADAFVRRMSARHGVSVPHLADDLYAALTAYPWPGNVRELENVIQRAVILSRSGTLTASDLPAHLTDPTDDPCMVSAARAEAAAQSGSTLGGLMDRTERQLIEEALVRNGFNRTRTAKELGISRVTLYNKIRKHGI